MKPESNTLAPEAHWALARLCHFVRWVMAPEVLLSIPSPSKVDDYVIIGNFRKFRIMLVSPSFCLKFQFLGSRHISAPATDVPSLRD